MLIEMALSSYDDIFSDFDIRNYRQRQISKDFLDELKIRMIKRIDDSRPLIILVIERSKRNIKNEKLIIKRLNAFFYERYFAHTKKLKRNIIISIISIVCGLVLLFVANIISKHIDAMFGDFLLIPSWYLVWNAFERVLGNSKEIKRKIKYYKELSKSTIEFKDREETQ